MAGKIIQRAELAGGATVNGTEVIDANGNITANIQDTLASGKIYVGNASNVSAEVAVSGDATLSNAGVLTVTGASGPFQAFQNFTFQASVILASTETIAAGGTSTAIDLTKYHHYIDADAGGDIFTVAAGTPGQVILLEMASATGTATITPASFSGGTSITFNAAGDTVELYYSGASSAWIVKGGNSYAII